MHNIVPIKNVSNQSTVIRATVKSISGNNVIIETDFGVISSQPAFSCFLKPEVNDLVLVDYSNNQCYVLSVLERTDKIDIDIQYPANVNMHAANGDINISSDNDMRFTARKKSTFVASEASYISDRINILAGTIDCKASQLQSHLKDIRVFTDSMDIVADQIKQRANTIMRWVEGLESSNVGNLVQRVRHTLTSHSKQSVVTSEKDMRIDAERIHMG